MIDGPTHVALGAWSGGRFMHYGEPLEEERLVALLRPDELVPTVVTADVYGCGEADRLVGRALAGRSRESFRLIGMVGHDFVDGTRAGAKGFPRFTDPALRGPDGYEAYLRGAVERSLDRCGVDRFDVLLLHNPDRVGYTSPAVWDAMARIRDDGLAVAVGIAPGPANGFTLDVISCVERFGDLIERAMLILNPFEPWPARLALPALDQAGVRVLARVVDYGGVFHDDLAAEDAFDAHDHRAFRPAGWVAQARTKLDRIRPIGERLGLTPLQLSCAWTLAQPGVDCVVPTLIQERGGRPVERQREELAGVPAGAVLSPADLASIDLVGDNAGCMKLKGGSPAHTGDDLPDAWELGGELQDAADRWRIVPERDLVQTMA